MQIDWLTTAAQFINFFVLVWLLRRFLFHPVSDAIEARRARIADTVAEAASREAEATAERDALKVERDDLAAGIQARMAAAEADAEAYGAKLRSEAEDAAGERRAEMAADLDRERASLGTVLKAEAGRTGIEIARRVFDDLADAELEALLLRRLGRELAAQEDVAGPGAEGSAIVATLTCRWPHADQTADIEERLGADLARILGRPVTLQIRHSPEAPVGAVLEAPGLSAEWTLAGHLDRIAERFEAHAEAGFDPAVAV